MQMCRYQQIIPALISDEIVTYQHQWESEFLPHEIYPLSNVDIHFSMSSAG